MVNITINDKYKFSAIKMRVENNSFEFKFDNSQNSICAYRYLIENGIQCYHAGSNAPHGPFVAIYTMNNENLKIKVTA